MCFDGICLTLSNAETNIFDVLRVVYHSNVAYRVSAIVR